MGINKVSLTSQEYASYLAKTSSHNNTGYLNRHTKTGQFTVFYKPKGSSDVEKGYAPLTLREITQFGFKFKKELIARADEAKTVSIALKRMSQHKTGKKNPFIQHVYDLIRNFLSGHGFKSTSQLAEKLSQELFPYGVDKSPIPPSPQKTRRDASLKKYKDRPDTCTEKDFFLIFGDIFQISRTKKYVEDLFLMKNQVLNHSKIFCVLDLMLYVLGIDKIDMKAHPLDLNHEKCMRVIVDTFQYQAKSIHVCFDLAEWLRNHIANTKKLYPINATLFKKCFQVFIDLHKENKKFHLNGLLLLIRTYQSNSPPLPTNMHELFAALSILIEGESSFKNSNDVIEWVVKQSDYDLESCKTLIKAYYKHETTMNQHGCLPGDGRFFLVNHFKTTSWASQLDIHGKDKEVAEFLHAFGAF